MNDPVPPAGVGDPLRGHLLGRRAWHRVACGHAVLLSGTDGQAFQGETVDLSRGGALIAVTDPALGTGEGDATALVGQRFPTGVGIAFQDAGIRLHAQIARATLQRGAHLALGCAFERVLDAKEALQLGIVAGEVGVAEATEPRLPYEPRSGVALSLVLEGEPAQVVGPLALGPITALGERTVEARLGRSVDATVEACAEVLLGVHLVVGKQAVWSGRGTLVSCRPDGEGSLARVVAGADFSRDVLKRLRAASGA